VNGLDSGTVFKLTPNGTTYAESIVYNFCSQANCVDGGVPQSGLISDASGALYGTTEFGGNQGFGTAFKVTP
jgi:uncharacterized repeat protein (TIGR03803 family)